MTQSVILNLKDPTTLETGIAFTQGDYGEEAVLQILTKDDDTYITDALSASISFTRSDGYIVTGELTGGGGIYQYQFKGNELQSAGKAVAVVTLEFEGGRVSTGSFAFNVRYNPMFDRGIDAGPYIWELEKIVASAKSYVEYLETLIEQLKPGIGSTALTKADLVNGFDQVEAGIKALDAAAGKRLWDKFGDYILKKQIVNNLLATQPGNPLDATQGKILADKFAQLNSDTSENFTNSEYFNDYVQFYRIGRIVYCSYGGDIKKLVPSKEVQILKLPQKFLPVKDYILMTSPPTGGTIQITISKIGWIVAYNYGQEIASLSPSRFSAAYIAAE